MVRLFEIFWPLTTKPRPSWKRKDLALPVAVSPTPSVLNLFRLANPDLVDASGAVLKTGDFKHLAIANPKTAPYGAAAVEVMNKLGVLQNVQQRFVQGESIAQTHQFIPAMRN